MKTLQLTAFAITFLLALLPAASSAAPFTLSLDGTEVTDQGTGLIWRHCAEGLSGSQCGSGTASPFSHEAALLQATNESKSTGLAWRLPNVKELSSIVDVTVIPASYASFPATPTDRVFWSSSPYTYPNNAQHAWYVDFNVGVVNVTLRNGINYVRLVRAG